MPFRCHVEGCGYKSTWAQTRGDRRALMQLPDTEDRERILQQLKFPPNTDIGKYFRICDKHFTSDSLVWRGPGVTLRNNPVVINCKEELLLKPVIGGVIDFWRDFPDALSSELENGWKAVMSDVKITFFCGTYDISTKSVLSKSIDVDLQLHGKAFVNNETLHHQFEGQRLTEWEQLRELMNFGYLATKTTKTFSDDLKQVIDILHTLDVDYEYPRAKVMIPLLIDQLTNLLKSCPRQYRWSYETKMVGAYLKGVSPHAYHVLGTFLLMPSTDTLLKLTNKFSTTDNDGYFNTMCKELSPRDRIVSLAFDEIYMQAGINMKNGKLHGYDANGLQASTLQSFFVQSVFGKGLKELVDMVPTKIQTAQDLAKMVLERVRFLQMNDRFKVLTTIADNNQLNRKAFLILTSQPGGRPMCYFENPNYPGELIFTISDPTHLFKNARNNWINALSLQFPDFEEVSKSFNASSKNVSSDMSTYEASFHDVRTLQAIQESDLLKTGYRLNRKVVYPGPFDRQNVKLVVALFHSSTIAALEEAYNALTDAQKQGSTLLGTTNFMNIILKWWSIVSCKSATKGFHKLDDNSKPFYRDTYQLDARYIWMKNFVRWLEVWEQDEDAKGHRFTTDTLSAFKATTIAFIELTDYVFTNVPLVDYILLGKFTTDQLEEIFGKLRQLSGGKYRISTVEAAENMKKLRDRHWMRTQLLKGGLPEPVDLPMKTPFEICEEILNPFKIVLTRDFTPNVHAASDHDIMYVAGFSARRCYKRLTAVRRSCSTCWALLIDDKGGLSSSEYFNKQQRGGLIIPSDFSEKLTRIMIAILVDIDSDDQLKPLFIASEINQRALLMRLLMDALRYYAEDDFDAIDLDLKCSNCEVLLSEVVHKFSIPLSNVLLNAFARRANDIFEKERIVEKVRKANKRSLSQSRTNNKKVASENIALSQMKRKLIIFNPYGEGMQI